MGHCITYKSHSFRAIAGCQVQQHILEISVYGSGSMTRDLKASCMHAKDQSVSIARLLSRAIGSCQAAGAAVLIYPRPPEERQNRHDRLPPFQRVPPLQLRQGARPPQHHCVEPLAAAVAVRRRLERFAAADWRQRLQVTN